MNILFGIILTVLMCNMACAQNHNNSNCIPAPRNDWSKHRCKHMTNLAKKQKNGQTVPLLLLGDSITQLWHFPKGTKYPGGLDSWNKHFKPIGAVNFGISGDLNENLLWRITTGEQLKINPKIIVLLIGTNNLHGKNTNSAEQAARGIKLITDTIKKKLPTTKVLLLGILPRTWPPSAVEKVKEINKIIAKYADNQHIFYFDAGPALLDKNGKVSKKIFRDGLHLSSKGYEIFAQALLPEINKILKSKE